jgi:hypothetical protein
MYVEAYSASVSLAEDPFVGELVKELSRRYNERQMAQSGLRKENPAGAHRPHA